MRLIEALGDIVPICQAPTMKDLELTVWKFMRGIWNECHARNKNNGVSRARISRERQMNMA